METINSAYPSETVFATNTAGVHANTRRPGMLLDKLWQEGELAVLFGDTGVGKSQFAVQAAEAVSRGKTISGFATN
ncbi:MAG TPA: AAA family ATPase, partial [Bacteroidia bacterium]|nr:AAA family ATPase [Bacteroidia bacterium]